MPDNPLFARTSSSTSVTQSRTTLSRIGGCPSRSLSVFPSAMAVLSGSSRCLEIDVPLLASRSHVLLVPAGQAAIVLPGALDVASRARCRHDDAEHSDVLWVPA